MSLSCVSSKTAWFGVLFLAASLPMIAQVKQADDELKPPQLRLEITPVKHVYKVGETVFISYKLTSVTDGTLCFPPPNLEVSQHFTGYFSTLATLPGVKDITRFLESFWEKSPSVERLRTNVADIWVKLGMSEPYKPKGFGKVVVLTEPGKWELQSSYYPPELDSSQIAIVKSLGCSPPTTRVDSDPVSIGVVRSQQ